MFELRSENPTYQDIFHAMDGVLFFFSTTGRNLNPSDPALAEILRDPPNRQRHLTMNLLVQQAFTDPYRRHLIPGFEVGG